MFGYSVSGWLLAALAFSYVACAQAEPAPAQAIRDKLLDPSRGVFIVAHRGCHNPAPARNLPSAPENSLAAMDNCIALGVDMMELDVRRTKDGVLMILHDETVDRTTNGHGRLSDLTLAEVKRLRLRNNLGGHVYPGLTAQAVPTLAEALQHARDRIMLNLDIKEEIYPEAIAAALGAGLGNQVLVKRVAAQAGKALGDQAPYDKVPFMPVVGNWPANPPAGDIAAIAAQQLEAKIRPVGVELVFLTPEQFTAVRRSAKNRKVRLWVNTLSDVIGVIGAGNDLDALRTHGKTWGDMMEQGIDTFQTDEPAALIDYLSTRKQQN